jgi:mevalonate kinase
VRDVSRQSVVSAPGKVILMGEHAAVYGHPAVVAAIDLRLRVSATPRADDKIRIDLPELHHVGSATWEEVEAYAEMSRAHWRRHFVEPGGNPASYAPLGGPADRLVRLALGETVAQHPALARRGVDLRVDSRLPLGSGFGSSAALAVGVAAAYLALADHEQGADLLQRVSLEVERRQHGLPSGVDHNAVLRGGVLWAQRTEHGELIVEPIVASSALLSGLRIFHSGVPAESTGVLVAAVRRRIELARQKFKAVLDRIDDATRGLRALLLGDEDEPSRLIALIRQAEAALEELGVVPEPIKNIIRKIEAAGGAAKISGAGALSGEGGGSILVYHPDPDRIARWDFLAGWLPLPVRLGSEGLRSEAPA